MVVTSPLGEPTNSWILLHPTLTWSETPFLVTHLLATCFASTGFHLDNRDLWEHVFIWA